jgi:hypothetical protein
LQDGARRSVSGPLARLSQHRNDLGNGSRLDHAERFKAEAFIIGSGRSSARTDQPTFEARQGKHRGCTVGKDARMRLEKSIALSAACAASLMQERRRSCAKGSAVSTLPVA